MKDVINRAVQMYGAGASTEDIHHMLTKDEGLTQAQAYYTYKAAEVIVNSYNNAPETVKS